MYYGQDHPAGTWDQRHIVPAAVAFKTSSSEKFEEDPEIATSSGNVPSTVDVAVNEPLTLRTAMTILISPITWLPSLAYLTTFGLELAIDAQMANVLFSLFGKTIPGFNQTVAGYYTAILYVHSLSRSYGPITHLFDSGFLNLVTRPLGGYIGDRIYRPLGTKGKKYWTLVCGFVMGITFLAGGLYLQRIQKSPRTADCKHPIHSPPFFI